MQKQGVTDMYIVLLKFAANKAAAGDHMQGHRDWLQAGFERGHFLLAGSIVPGAGGAILANGVSKEDLDAIVNQDPFVKEDVVTAEILEIEPAKLDARLQFLSD